MGSGSRFIFGFDPHSWLIGFTISRFPFSITIGLSFLCFYLSIGFGPGYDEVKVEE